MARVDDMATSFVEEIKLMMFGLGDCKEPLHESAVFVELILIEEMQNLLDQATEAMELREGSCLEPKDILFLMKDNEVALKRFITYISFKDEKVAYDREVFATENVTENDNTDMPDTIIELTNEENSLLFEVPRGLPPWKNHRKEYCLQYLSFFDFDETDFSDVQDCVKEERNARASNISLNLTPTAYQQYHAARCKSFASANMDKFEKWLKNKAKRVEFIDKPVIEILEYLAKETIACLMDMVLTIREEHDMVPTDTPISTSELREAVRRHTFLQTERNALFSRDVGPVIHRRLISF